MNLEYLYEHIDKLNTDGQINDHYIKGILQLFNSEEIPQPATFPSIEDPHGIMLRWVDNPYVISISFDPDEATAYIYNRTTEAWDDGTLWDMWRKIQYLFVCLHLGFPNNNEEELELT